VTTRQEAPLRKDGEEMHFLFFKESEEGKSRLGEEP
jgi:hypothetical protein